MDFLRQKFASLEAQMGARLAELRATQTNMSSLGTGVENVLRDFLREYLPRRLDVGQGVVVDAKVGRSRQTDVVIVTQDHPRTFEGNDPGLFFIEGVYAAGEVKTTLTTTECQQRRGIAVWVAPQQDLGVPVCANKTHGPPSLRHPLPSKIVLSLSEFAVGTRFTAPPPRTAAGTAGMVTGVSGDLHSAVNGIAEPLTFP